MRRTALTALLIAAVMAPPAAASDQSVYDAWVSRDAAFDRLGKEFRRAARAYRRSDGERIRPTLKVARKTIGVIDELLPAIKREQPGSDAGRRGKQLALTSVRQLRKSLVNLRRGVRAVKRSDGTSGGPVLRKSQRQARRARTTERKGRKAFRRAGVNVG
jgi:hypothetical protein